MGADVSVVAALSSSGGSPEQAASASARVSAAVANSRERVTRRRGRSAIVGSVGVRSEGTPSIPPQVSRFWETGSYSDSKLCVTTLAAAVARLRPDVLANSVDPGWVPTKMGGPSASDDLELGPRTQEWLATSADPEALTSGGHWHHGRRVAAAPAVGDRGFQDRLLDELARFTGERLG